MRKLLVLAFLLYDILSANARANDYDYERKDSEKHYMQKLNDRKNWRKKVLSKVLDDRRDWNRYEYVNRAEEDLDTKLYDTIDRPRDMDVYRQRRYDNALDKIRGTGIKSSEVSHTLLNIEKEVPEKKLPLEMSCQRPHEKFESCFAGCAAVSCDNPRDRLQPCYPFCEAGCVCAPPRVRDDRTHKCVLPEECTKGLKGIPDLGEEVAV